MAILVDRLTPADLRTGRRVHWLLDLTFAGQVVRLADDELDIEAEDGTTLHYHAALGDIEVSEALSLLGDSSGQGSVPVEAVLPVDVPALVARGHSLGAATGVLCRWVEGTVRESARTVMVGRVSDPEYGAADEPVNFSLEEMIADDAGLMGSPLARVDGYTWAHADTLLPEHLGLQYPIVIGKPGAVSAAVDSDRWITGSAGLWIDFRSTVPGGGGFGGGEQAEVRLLVAGHHCTAADVHVSTDEFPSGVRMVLRNGYDGRGQPVCFVPWFISSVPANAPDDDVDTVTYNYSTTSGSRYSLGSTEASTDASFGDQAAQPTVYVGWYDETDGGGGLKLAGGLVRDAGPALAYVLGWTTLPVDQGRIQATYHALSRYKIDAVIETRCKPWDWIRDNLLPLLPITICSGPSGLFWVVWPLDATAADATVVLDADSEPEISRVSPVRFDTSDIANRFTLKYAYSYRKQRHNGSITLGAAGDAPNAADSDTTFRAHPLCTTSRARLGYTIDREISTVVVYDDSTAWAILENLARIYALPRRVVDYQVPEIDFVHVERGAVVRLTDSEVGFDEQAAILTGIKTDGSGYLVITLTIFDDPGRDLKQ
ncbi:MAG: hypothetical protein RL139_1353 [Gemmatimonadota bacterium]